MWLLILMAMMVADRDMRCDSLCLWHFGIGEMLRIGSTEGLRHRGFWKELLGSTDRVLRSTRCVKGEIMETGGYSVVIALAFI